MQNFCKVFGILMIPGGILTIMLGALYKIQSWHPPAIGSMDIDVLLVGMVTTAIGIALITVSSLLGAKQPAERLDLDENRIPKSKVKEPLHDEDLLV